MNSRRSPVRPELEAVLQAALAAVEPGQAVRRAFGVEGGELVVDGRRYRFAEFRRVLVVGAGKASAPMAAAVEDVVDGRAPVEGSVTVRYGHAAPTRRVRIREAGHPVPDAAGVQATRAIVELLEETDARDLVVCVISGGGSALLTLPTDGIALADLQQTTDALLRSGASINDVNVVRKHLDMVKGGGLARLAAPARVLTLVLSDVVGNPLDAIASGPTVPDTSTWSDAATVFDRYGLWSGVPASVADRLRAGLAGHLAETPKSGDPIFEHTQTVVVGSNLVAGEAAVRAAERLGCHAVVLTSFVEGEAREVGRVLAGVLREVDASGHPLPRPCCIVAGGETTVTVRGQGRGGRNQELCLAAAAGLRGLKDVLLASIGTDGNDGPTDAAGAFVDGTTFDRAAALGLDPASFLANNDSYTFFDRLGDLIRTGPTNTNVNDLYLLFAF
ncbi:MAG TPA: glycerate kinase [Chloroflexota bacterium]|nr:glycerate kinase [Chloroflexota bacterium]